MKILNQILQDIKHIIPLGDKERLMKSSLPYLLFFVLGTILSHHIASYQGGDVLDRVFAALSQLDQLAWIFVPSGEDLLVGFLASLGLVGVLSVKKANRKKFRHGVEYGSARWGTREDIAPCIC